MKFGSIATALLLGVGVFATSSSLAWYNDQGYGSGYGDRDPRFDNERNESRYYGGFYDRYGKRRHRSKVSLGPRPRFLVDGMDRSPLKRRLKSCQHGPFFQTNFSIGHRGAPLMIPEHTKESYIAAARQGAGILECDVTFTKDGKLVCRHAQCDLHTTTNILVRKDLVDTCVKQFEPAEFDPISGERTKAASAKCCTSDLTRREFLTLKGKMDAANPDALTPEEYIKDGTADWRTDLYDSRGTLMTHRQSIRLFEKLHADYTPELKNSSRAPGNFDEVEDLVKVWNADGDPTDAVDVQNAQKAYAQALIDDYKALGIPPRRVWAQSFNPEDVKYWINNELAFGIQAVYLDDRYDEESFDPLNGDPASFLPTMEEIAADGVKVIAPPMYFLLRVTDDGEIVPSNYALAAKNAGLQIIAWTFERSDIRNGSRGANGDVTDATFYYQFDVNPNAQAINKDSDMYKALDVLAKDVGILGIFSDWPATVTYYANCMGLR